jgi:hypothetical protein
LQRGGTGLCKEPVRSLSSGRLPTSISLELDCQRNVIAKSRSCKITAARGPPFSQHSVFFSPLCVNKIYFPLMALRSPVTQVGAHWQTPPTIFSIGGGTTFIPPAAPSAGSLPAQPGEATSTLPTPSKPAIPERREESLFAFDFCRTRSTHGCRIRRNING